MAVRKGVQPEGMGDTLDMIYENMEGNELLMQYHARHGTPSLLILTQYSPEVARESARLMARHIDGKRVIEIGAGIGMLAVEMAKRAKSVVAIEIDPAWSWVFTRYLYRAKPDNLTWIFGKAETAVEWGIRGDVVIIATRSGIDEMKAVAKKLAPKTVMLFQDIPESDTVGHEPLPKGGKR